MFVRILFALVAATALGTLCGWLTGLNDPESVALAAVPAILSIAGTLLFWKFGNLEENGHAVVFIVAFSVTFAWGVIHGGKERDDKAALSIIEARKHRFELLFECSRTEQFVNAYRDSRGQPPLAFGDVCDLGQ